MMTSVTLPSNSGPMHGAFTPTVPEDPPMSGHDFEVPRPAKRCLATTLSDNCKKRRKQSTPVRISASDSSPEGKPVPSPEPESRCPICQVVFATQDLLQSHMSSEHSNFECKREPCDSPNLDSLDNQDTSATPEQLITKPDIPWISEIPGKEWMSPNLLPFPTTNHMFMGLPQFTQPDALPPRQPIRIFNPDAYCELCNKEFCNKYFLKTHKANKHGIYTDPPAETAGLGSSVSIPSYVTNMKIPNSVPSVDISSVKIEPKPQLLQSYPDLFPNPFTNKLFPKIGKSVFEMENPENGSTNDAVSANDQEESPSPRAPQSEPPTSMKQEISDQEGMFYASPSKTSPGQQSRELDLSNRLRRIGVMNPKAFCEICCKEYCNKYFLRTHKMKRHGIYIPDDRDKDMKIDSMGVHYVQTSPLNLIMAEQQATNSSIDRKTSSPSDISCEICGIKFQNMSLFQLHNVSVHSKLPTTSQEATNDDKKQSDHFDKAGNSADSISEDLQKLQTMILQLNDLDVSKANSTCTTCNKEFENRYYLHAHMMTEHGLLLEDNGDTEKSGEAGDAANINNNTMCDLCGKDFQNYDDMKKHIIESHGAPVQPSETKEQDFNNGPTTSEKGPIRTPVTSTPVIERRATMNLTPTSSYCEICNKELCNKYFMKTHMQRMHGIEIENGAQIGGVICDICNKELCSKYFLRVHKHNTHGIVEYGSGLMQPRKGEEAAPPMPVEPDNALKPTDLADLSHRYFTHFTEVCTICSRRFRSTKWLKAHLLSDHGQAGAEKWAEMEQQLQHTMNQPNKSSTSTMKMPQGERISPTLKIPTSVESSNQQQKMGLQNVLSSILGADTESTSKTYHCSYCPFTTPVLPFLFVHERSHSLQSVDGELKCPVCSQTFPQPELLQHHIFTQHPFLPLPPFFNGNTESQGEISKEPSESAEENEDGGSLSDMSKQQPQQQHQQQQHMKIKSKVGGVKRKQFIRPDGMPADMDQVLKESAKKLQLPATYAIPQPNGDDANYVMQAFLVEENTATEHTNNIRKFVPSVVFLPVSQKMSSPVTATFTLTPA
ncbi:PREDICTED: uncharacterized protein LOC108565815 [Nicrophorus vespilloides]|uniref:Uncharacterized protein LOC108565815 n=1 Tax=Nicrophorus vespilloides TaxID=110193 RepID=A0ABM1N2A0_NICVS|nr:PREDICTED: uncharacterized protein LOC108565815 [Nicrophorus vespilloides]XP_017780950.1 PREDICTED: uncharacterized protein LOC108565815 [Nicrophorus vespilloides]